MQPLEATDPLHVGRYTLLNRLGAGGMGQVYLARSPGDRLVAVKTVHRQYAADEEFRIRFAREVLAARQVSGAFTAPVLDADPEAEIPWLATAYIKGPTLQAEVEARGPMAESEVRVLAAGLAEALIDVHRCGLIHRDLKPANVLLAEDGPRVLDFGIARAADGLAITGTGVTVGTPGYWSPEQVEGQELDARSDVFSLGAVLVLASSGRPAFGTGAALTMLKRVSTDPPDLSGVPDSLRPLLLDCLAKERAARPDPEEILNRLGDARGAAPLSGTAPVPVGETPAVAPTRRWGEGSDLQAAETMAPERTLADIERLVNADAAGSGRVPDVRDAPGEPVDSDGDDTETGKDPEKPAEEAVPDGETFQGALIGMLLLFALPVIQLPVGWMASALWAWFTQATLLPDWHYPGFFTADGFLHALRLGYLLATVVPGWFVLLGAARKTFNHEMGRSDWGGVLGVVISMVIAVLFLLG
ncbi:serine/threonine-protein kinase [Nocardiopsis ansamitocini]|uniref:Protein kinase domain-containing protein n=1 Tax=Nocardiopsis ansamitocini TaxID=1670832 RepID=A0A9W6P6X2_9ACTN|nr:serine/threonine-protein kinase [Nocardiopsis ansamitocini]GLU48113.1 hypothetical protein Nans01_24640 [Nocardiopsis ansamitocini]